MIKTYALFGWIANLGVVPLFSFAFFLLAPAFFFFNFLLILVCVVFEDIFYSLSSIFNIFNRDIFLSRIPPLVKIFLILLLCPQKGITKEHDHFLAKGEQIELSIEKLKTFSVGNKEVIKYKYLPRKNKILIKAKSMGFSDIIIWNQHGKKQTHNLYITSKKEQLKRMEFAQVLNSTGLHLKYAGNILYVEGTIKTLSEYLLIKNLEGQKQKNTIFNLDLDQELKNIIIAKIYEEFYSSDYRFISCFAITTQINCEYETNTENNHLLKKYQQTYRINFTNLMTKKTTSNYVLELKVLSTEKNQQYVRNTGINKIESDLMQLINENQFQLATGDILLQDENLSSKIIASPKFNLILDSPFNYQIGGEIPYSNKNKEKEIIEWKFAGLKISGQIKMKKGKILLKYNSLLTTGNQTGINGPKGNSSIYLIPNKNYHLYSIELNNYQSSAMSTPWINKIPILKNLFSSNSRNQNIKSVSIFAKLIEKKS